MAGGLKEQRRIRVSTTVADEAVLWKAQQTNGLVRYQGSTWLVADMELMPPRVATLLEQPPSDGQIVLDWK